MSSASFSKIKNTLMKNTFQQVSFIVRLLNIFTKLNSFPASFHRRQSCSIGIELDKYLALLATICFFLHCSVSQNIRTGKKFLKAAGCRSYEARILQLCSLVQPVFPDARDLLPSENLHDILGQCFPEYSS